MGQDDGGSGDKGWKKNQNQRDRNNIIVILQAAISGEEWIAPSLAWGGGEEYRKKEKTPGHTLPAPPTTIAPRLDPELAKRHAPSQPPPSRPPPRLEQQTTDGEY